MADHTTAESQFKVSDGRELYMKQWLPSGSTAAKLVFVHGFSDHVHRYYDLFPTLASRGIHVTGYDQRGFGRSVKKPSEKGDAGPTSLVLSDLVEVIRSVLPSDGAVPVFLMGHSMGGGIVCTLASTPQYADLMPKIRGLILESPLIALAFKPSPFTVFAGRLAGKALPHHQLKQAIPPKDLSRDPLVVESLAQDKMCDGTGSLQMFAAMLDRSAHLENGTLRLVKSVQAIWCGHGTHDLAVSHDASKKWVEAQSSVEDRIHKSYEGWYHQLHSDTPETRVMFYKDVGDWILERIGGEELNAGVSSKAGAVTATGSTEAPAGLAPAEEAVVESSTAAPIEEQAKL